MPPKKGSKKKPAKANVIFSSKEPQVESFADVAKQVKLQESYKSLLLGVAVVLLVTVLIFGYLKNRITHTQPQKTSVTMTPAPMKKDNLGEYTVQSGDDLKSIAIKYYNVTDPFVAIAKENNLTNPDQIDEGKKLIIPKLDKAMLLAPLSGKPERKDTISGTSYTVQDGDLLWDIAVRAYGDGYKSEKIMKENNLPSSDAIFSGMILQISR